MEPVAPPRDQRSLGMFGLRGASGFASAWQIQKSMLTVIYRMEHRAPPMEELEKVLKELKGSATL